MAPGPATFMSIKVWVNLLLLMMVVAALSTVEGLTQKNSDCHSTISGQKASPNPPLGGSAVEEIAAHGHRQQKTSTPGFRLQMLTRESSCAGMKDRDRHERMKCAMERSYRRYDSMSDHDHDHDHYLTNKHIRSLTGVTEHIATSRAKSSRLGDDYEFPESAGNGEYLVPVYLGTPPQKASVIVDTGSDLSWIQATPCQACYTQEDPYFDKTKSSSYASLSCDSPMCVALLGRACGTSSCTYAYGYGDGSITEGYFSMDSFTAELTTGEQTKVDGFAFGLGVYNTGTFGQTGGEGILGLGQGPVSVPSQLGSYFGNKFSYCLVDYFSSGTQSSPMYFGDIAVPTSSQIYFTPIVSNPTYPTYYYISVEGVSVGDSQLSIDPNVFQINSSGAGGTILDSGTTITYMQRTAYDAVVAAYKAQVSYPTKTSDVGLDLCFDTSATSTPSFPLMTIHVDGADLVLPTSNTFIVLDSSTSCLAFAGSSDIAIIGNIQQQNVRVVYDLDNKRIGFAPEECSSS